MNVMSFLAPRDQDPMVPGPDLGSVIDTAAAVGFRRLRGGLSGQVDRLVTSALGRVPAGPVFDQLVEVAARLRRPLQIAVAGQVSAGKSTLVNALLGGRIAATGEGETTRVFALYEFDENEGLEIRLRDGRCRRRPLTRARGLPDDLGVPLNEIDVVRVRVSTSGELSRFTLLDTPGLDGVRETASVLTQRRLFGGAGSTAADADALLFVLQTGGRARESKYLDSFRELTAGALSCSLNAIGVLSRCDADDVDDPLGAENYGRVAARLGRELASRLEVATVVPIIGLLAETVRAGLLGEAHLAALRRLTDEPPELMTAHVDRFRRVAGGKGLDGVMVEQLLRLLAPFGLRRALLALRGGVPDLPGLYRVLLAESGFDRMLEQVERLFLPRADALKADQALGAVLRLTYQLPEPLGEALRGEVEELLLSPRMHGLRELWAVRQCTAGAGGAPAVLLPDWLRSQLPRLTGSGGVRAKLGLPSDADPDDVRRTAAALAGQVHAYANAPTTWMEQRQVADVLRLSYAALWQQAGELKPDTVDRVPVGGRS
jgi:hypothetical protein